MRFIKSHLSQNKVFCFSCATSAGRFFHGSTVPAAGGFVESLGRPGGNVTGLTNLNRELGGKRLELLSEAAPNLARVAVLYSPATPRFAREVKEDLPVAAHATNSNESTSKTVEKTAMCTRFSIAPTSSTSTAAIHFNDLPLSHRAFTRSLLRDQHTTV